MKKLTQLDFQRRWLLAQLDHGNPSEVEAQSLIERIESLDLQIAATPASDLEGLFIKIKRLADLYWPADNTLRDWLKRIGVRTLYIEPGSLWENGYNESLNGKPRDGLLNGEIFYSLKLAQIIFE